MMDAFKSWAQVRGRSFLFILTCMYAKCRLDIFNNKGEL